jgi:hypothetical protein
MSQPPHSLVNMPGGRPIVCAFSIRNSLVIHFSFSFPQGSRGDKGKGPPDITLNLTVIIVVPSPGLDCRQPRSGSLMRNIVKSFVLDKFGLWRPMHLLTPILMLHCFRSCLRSTNSYKIVTLSSGSIQIATEYLKSRIYVKCGIDVLVRGNFDGPKENAGFSSRDHTTTVHKLSRIDICISSNLDPTLDTVSDDGSSDYPARQPRCRIPDPRMPLADRRLRFEQNKRKLFQISTWGFSLS